MVLKKPFFHARATAYSAYVQPMVQRGLWVLTSYSLKDYNRDKAFHLLHKKKRVNIKGFTGEDMVEGFSSSVWYHLHWNKRPVFVSISFFFLNQWDGLLCCVCLSSE